MPEYIKKIVSFFALTVLLFAHSVSAGNKVYRLSSTSFPDKLQIAMDTEQKPQFNVLVLSNPLRLVVDIKAQVATTYENNLNFKHRGVRTVRTGMQDKNTIRMVLELNRNYRWQAYSVPADVNHPFSRILIDVYDGRNVAGNTARPVDKQTQQVSKTPSIALESFGEQQQQAITKPVVTTVPKPVAKTKPIVKPVVAPVTPVEQVATVQETPKIPTDVFAPTGGAKVSSVQPVVQSIAKPTAKTSSNKPPQISSDIFSSVDVSTTNSSIIDEPVVSKTPIKETPIKRKNSGTLVVVIDAGHGGKDSGALGKYGTQEKRVVLQIAKKLKVKIDAIPGMRAILTRRNDRYISLRGRLRLARKYKADLFVSIHADAAHNRSARGSSVYILSNRGASSESARWLAQRENAVDLKYGVDIGDYDEDVSNMIMQIQQDATIESSHRLAKKTLRGLRRVGKLHKSHVERAGFAVLKSPDIPSMLVETAFISNPKEEKRLKSPVYQDKLANAIADGIKSYFAFTEQ